MMHHILKKGLIICIILISPIFPTLPGVDYDSFGRLPVLSNGRIKPIDSVARNSLMLINGHQTFQNNGHKTAASEWLLEVLSSPETADTYPIFRIDNPDLKSTLKQFDELEKYFSFNTLSPHLNTLAHKASMAQQIEPKLRTAYQNATVNLYNHLLLYHQLKNWQSMPTQLLTFYKSNEISPLITQYRNLFDAYQKQNIEEINYWLSALTTTYQEEAPKAFKQAYAELIFNHIQPFYISMSFYLVAFIFVCISLLKESLILKKLAFYTLIIGAMFHTGGLLSRMILQGRPPVTNLYSSAVFVGFGTVILSILFELFYRNRIGILVATSVGFITLIIAHHLSLSGDTLEMMQAVLDSNFWLATHVVTISIGYSATFLAGTMGVIYVIRTLFGYTSDNNPLQVELIRMAFSVVCFALFFSFVGTVLGGIWADQSWGRFWGWDPKENGALLIVIWNALVLHLRLSGHIKNTSFMSATIFGNIVTAFSWFGVNMLGIGLHSYGFMSEAMTWLWGFSFTQLLIIIVGLIFHLKKHLKKQNV